MNKTKHFLNKTAFICGFVIIAMLILAMLFWQERMFFLDPNWMTFQFLQKENIAIQESRYGSFITQIFPFIGMKLGLGSIAILKLYNASFYLFFAFSYILLYKWKQFELNILLIVYFTLFVGDVFFWPNNEVHQGVVWAFLGMGLFFKLEENQSITQSSKLFYFISILLIGLGIITHFLVILAIIPIWIYRTVQKLGPNKALKSKYLYTGLGILFSFLAVRILLSSGAGYDRSKLGPIKHLKIQTLFEAFLSPHAIDFYKFLSGRFIVVSFIILIVTYLLIKRKNYWSFTIYITSILAYWILINLIFPNRLDRSQWFYMESEYQIASIIIFAPLIFMLKPNKRELNITYIIVILSIISFGVRLPNAYQLFNTRLKNLDSLITYKSQKGITKGIFIIEPELSKHYFLMDWNMPIESIMRSSTKGIQPLSIKILPTSSDWHIDAIKFQKDSLLSSFTIEHINSLPKEYLQLDTINSYQIMDFNEIENNLKPLY